MPDLNDLRNAAEALHILQLRGCVVKASGRQVTEHARALAMYGKIPPALFGRFEKSRAMLQDFESLKAFHQRFPQGTDGGW